MIELLDLTICVNKIKTGESVFGGRVFKTIPDEKLSIDHYESPTVFVYLSEDSSEDNTMKNDSAVIQQMYNEVAVEIIIRRSTDITERLNESAVDAIRTYRTEVFNKLVGWRPDGTIKKVRHISGKLKEKDAKQIKWIDLFAVEKIITN